MKCPSRSVPKRCYVAKVAKAYDQVSTLATIPMRLSQIYPKLHNESVCVSHMCGVWTSKMFYLKLLKKSHKINHKRDVY